MAFFGKLFGAGLGWAFGGPIGAVIGAALGHALDSPGPGAVQRPRSPQADFSASLLVLSAAVMKADGKVIFIRDFYLRQFRNVAFVKEQMELLRDILKQDIPVRQVCEQIRVNMDHAQRLQLIHYLFGISQADGHVDTSEVEVIHFRQGFRVSSGYVL